MLKRIGPLLNLPVLAFARYVSEREQALLGKMVAERSNKRQAECSVFPPKPAEIFGPIREISMYIFSSMHNMIEWQSRRSQSQYYN